MKELSTWEIIKDGKVGERYETEENTHGIKAVIEIDKCGSIKYAEGHATENAVGQFLLLNAGTREAKWRLVQKYITFDEAKKLMLEGKKVKAWFDDGGFADLSIQEDIVDYYNFTFKDLFKAKFTVID